MNLNWVNLALLRSCIRKGPRSVGPTRLVFFLIFIIFQPMYLLWIFGKLDSSTILPTLPWWISLDLTFLWLMLFQIRILHSCICSDLIHVSISLRKDYGVIGLSRVLFLFLSFNFQATYWKVVDAASWWKKVKKNC